jgi:hypothetical protein
MAGKSQKRSKQHKAKKVVDLPTGGPKAKNVKGGRGEEIIAMPDASVVDLEAGTPPVAVRFVKS